MSNTQRFRSVAVLLVAFAYGSAAADPLESWNDGAAKKAIVAFVEKTADKTSPDFVPPEERIATFDQDGTLWVEQPMYVQVMYCIDRVPALVKARPSLAKDEPFTTVMSGGRAAVVNLREYDLIKIMESTLTGMSVDAFRADVAKWIAQAKNPSWKRPYTVSRTRRCKRC